MTDFASQRCFHHRRREAVARCPLCQRMFCRECVTEHDERVICAGCLAALAPAPPPARGRRLAALAPAAVALAGFVATWLCFYVMGRLLALVPAPFHEGALGGGG